MTILSYLIWNGSPEIFSMGTFALRWYGLFFALGFLIGQQIFYYIYKKEGKPEKDVDTLTIYMVIATILGARLGHVIFYQPEMFWENPLGIILPVEFSPFKFVGLQGLASHGAGIGIFIALWLYSRKKKPGQSYLQILDRIAILVALTGALIRFGNYFNSEIIGKPTDKPWAVVFVNRLTESIEDRRNDSDDIVESVAYLKNDSLPAGSNGRVPMLIYVFFKPGATEKQVNNLMDFKVKDILLSRMYDFIEIPVELHLNYQIAKQDNGAYATRINVLGIARHPSQLYESISCVFLFILLFLIWMRYKENLPPGRLFGIFLTVCFTLRFFYEFLKENQEAFESKLPINMGQILSIPFVLAGIIILLLSFRKKEKINS